MFFFVKKKFIRYNFNIKLKICLYFFYINFFKFNFYSKVKKYIVQLCLKLCRKKKERRLVIISYAKNLNLYKSSLCDRIFL